MLEDRNTQFSNLIGIPHSLIRVENRRLSTLIRGRIEGGVSLFIERAR